MRPEDPVFDGPLAYSGALLGEPAEELIQGGHAGRVAFQRRAADYLGCGFGDISALRRYARILTRQEVWDNHGREYASDLRAMDLKMGYYFSSAQSLRPGSVEGWYYDGIDPVDGYNRPALPGHVAELEAIDAIKIVPDDWVMPLYSAWPVWEFVDRFDMRGFPVLIAEAM